MNDSPAERPSPAAMIERVFSGILHAQMRDMPLVNPTLAVEAVGFRPWQDHWLGVVITPWFMNLWLMPRVVAKWQAIGERETRHHVFPAGVFAFIGGRDPVLGDYQACSLFSPMFEFTDQAAAHEMAVAVLDVLFDEASREAPEALPATPQGPAARASPPADAISKRDFLFRPLPRGDRGP
jgi:[NiFe] hydrogenase assembly HybE family chaperone